MFWFKIYIVLVVLVRRWMFVLRVMVERLMSFLKGRVNWEIICLEVVWVRVLLKEIMY